MYQINGKTVAIFSAVYTVRSTRTVFVSRGFDRDVFERLCERVGEGDEIVVLQVGATFTSENEPQESVSRATFSSMVQPYLVNGTDIFVN